MLLAALLAAATVPTLFVTDPVGELLPRREPDVLAVVLVVLGCMPLGWRRRYPLSVLVLVLPPTAVIVVFGYSAGFLGVSMLIALYTVAAYCGRVAALVGMVLTSGTFVLIVFADDYPEGAIEVIAMLGLTFGAWAFGRSVGFRRAYTSELEARAERLERSRVSDTRAALAEERGRIARELHDVVAHHVSVMTVQASAARRTIERDPERSREAMAAVEEIGRAALNEMRRIVGVLRSPSEEPAGRNGTVNGAALGPQPGVGEIEELIGQVREAGLDVDLTLEGDRRPLPAGVDLAAYRIVQEALTNSLKHAGPSRARVLLRYDSAELVIRVVDDGHGLAAGLTQQNGRRTGHGLLGMRERVSLYSGRLYAGPRAGGGFEVLARIPLDAASLAASRRADM
jgi:signal transduction histidine kinase